MPSFKLSFIILMSVDNRQPKTLRMTSADLSISHNSLRRLFLSLTTGAWNVVSMGEVQYSIMNQQDSTFKI